MSIFWEICDICNRHRLTKQCWLHPERNVCSYCCLACPERGTCPNPVWFTNIRVKVKISKVEKTKALEELLKRLGGS